MNRYFFLLLALVVHFGFTNAVFAQQDDDDAPPLAEAKKMDTDFIQLCSDLTIKDKDDYNVAVSACMGYIRGVADSHRLTVDVISEKHNDVKKVWCVPLKESDGKMFINIVNLIESNYEYYQKLKELIKQKADPVVSVRLAILFTFLNSAYPCEVF